MAFFTDSHHIVADVDTGARRLVEVLRDPTRGFLDVKHVHLTRLADPTAPGALISHGVLQKTDIRLATILTEANRGGRRLYGYVTKVTVRVLAVMPGCEIVGQLHLPNGTKDALAGFLKLNSFIHVGGATLSFVAGAALPMEVDTVILNRSSIQLLCLVD